MRVVVPFDERHPKTRLSDTLDEADRRGFARAMLGDVLGAVDAAACRADTPVVGRVTVLSTASLPPLAALVERDRRQRRESDTDTDRDRDTDTGEQSGDAPAPAPDREVVVDERALTPAVNDTLAGAGPTAVVMADLALATPSAVARLLADGAGAEGRQSVTLVPGRGGGTNALVARHPDFRVDYHGVSFQDHRQQVREAGAALRRVDSFRLSTDVDERADLPEVLLHGGPRSRGWLRRAGFDLAVTDGRVGVTRTGD